MKPTNKTATLCLFLSIALFLSLIPTYMVKASNSSSTETIVYIDDEIQITSTTIIYTSYNLLDTSSYSTKSATTTYTYKTLSGSVCATYTLRASFKYNGTSSSCTSANYSTSVSSSNYTFTSCSASKSGNTATGNMTLYLKNSSKSITKVLTLACDKNGNIS